VVSSARAILTVRSEIGPYRHPSPRYAGNSNSARVSESERRTGQIGDFRTERRNDHFEDEHDADVSTEALAKAEDEYDLRNSAQNGER
jgi:hypothetical protein